MKGEEVKGSDILDTGSRCEKIRRSGFGGGVPNEILPFMKTL
jgi:hypothetical protein